VVRGPGTVHLLDLSGAYEVRIETDTNVFEAEVAGDGLGLFSLANVTLHQLTAGDRIDLNTGRRKYIMLATPSISECTGARHAIHHIVHRCSPRHPPHSAPVLATPSTT